MGPSSPLSAIRTMVIIIAGASIVQVGAAQSRQSAASPTGVFIATDPLAATVFIDGKHAGLTPLRIEGIAAGTHRVKIVKSGYLENLQSVVVRSDQPTRLNVNLTRTSSPIQDPPQTQTQSSGDGLSKKWLWIGVAGGGAAAATLLVLNRNHAPDPGTILVTPTATGMAGQTSFTLQSTAVDQDKNSLTFTWNFGDGGSGSGQSVTHTYASAGTFQAQVTISDGKETVTAPPATVTVGPSLTGTWTGGSLLMPDPTGNITLNCGLTLALTQNGSTVSGSMSFASGCTGGPGSLASGSATPLTHPTTVSLASGSFAFPGGPLSQGLVILFAGQTNPAGTTLSGNVTLSNPSIGFVRTTSTSFTRQ